MTDLVPRAEHDRSAFKESHDPAAVSKLLDELNLTLKAEMEILQEGMAKTQPIKTRLKAQQQLRALLRDIRMASTILLTMTKREDGSIEQTAIAPRLIQDMQQENQVASQAKQVTSPYQFLPAAARDPLGAADSGIGDAALERALRRSIRPRSRNVDQELQPPSSEDGGSGQVSAVGDRLTEHRGPDDGDPEVLRDSGASGHDPELAGIWPPPEE